MARTIRGFGLALVMLTTGVLPSAAAGLRGEIVTCAQASGARAARIGDGRLLAPTRPATFVRHANDRCAGASGRPLAG